MVLHGMPYIDVQNFLLIKIHIHLITLTWIELSACGADPLASPLFVEVGLGFDLKP